MRQQLYTNPYSSGYSRKNRGFFQKLHIDLSLFISLLILSAVGLIILYSAASGDHALVIRQIIRLGIAFVIMMGFAQISPNHWQRWSTSIFIIGLTLLIAVGIMGVIGKGAQRWLHVGFLRFQPSEIMKLAIPMMLASYFQDRPLPPKLWHLFVSLLIIFPPVLLTAKQPDLGTAMMLACSGACVLLLAGMSWKLIVALSLAALGAAPVLWTHMHNYQQQRVLTFLNPERDPLGHGYHIIQSKIAIGSGGLFGKGWLSGTQSHLDFLPEHATDFIFAVAGEEFGLMGGIILLAIYMQVIFRGLYISNHAQDTYGRLLAGSLSLTFFFSIFVNIGMVIGILPVVGLPLPLVSYGGTSIVTIMAGFGLIMSIQTHRKLVPK